MSFVEELEKYFEVTPREKVLEDWTKSAEFDNVGISVEDFLSVSCLEGPKGCEARSEANPVRERPL